MQVARRMLALCTRTASPPVAAAPSWTEICFVRAASSENIAFYGKWRQPDMAIQQSTWDTVVHPYPSYCSSGQT